MHDHRREPLLRLYPELAAEGSLGDVLAQHAVHLGLPLGPLDPVEGHDAMDTARCARSSARFNVYATNREEHEFRVEITTDTGRPCGAFGSTPNLGVVTAILHTWCSGATLEELQDEWPLLAATPLAAAPPGRVVSTAWQLMLARSPAIRLGAADLTEALHEQPALRVFFPFPSHGHFSLLSSTGDPFREEVPRVTPAGDDSWNVLVWQSQEVLGTRLSAQEAAAVVAANIPDDAGPAVEGGWPDGGGHPSYA